MRVVQSPWYPVSLLNKKLPGTENIVAMVSFINYTGSTDDVLFITMKLYLQPGDTKLIGCKCSLFVLGVLCRPNQCCQG